MISQLWPPFMVRCTCWLVTKTVLRSCEPPPCARARHARPHDVRVLRIGGREPTLASAHRHPLGPRNGPADASEAPRAAVAGTSKGGSVLPVVVEVAAGPLQALVVNVGRAPVQRPRQPRGLAIHFIGVVGADEAVVVIGRAATQVAGVVHQLPRRPCVERTPELPALGLAPVPGHPVSGFDQRVDPVGIGRGQTHMSVFPTGSSGSPLPSSFLHVSPPSSER